MKVKDLFKRFLEDLIDHELFFQDKKLFSRAMVLAMDMIIARELECGYRKPFEIGFESWLPEQVKIKSDVKHEDPFYNEEEKKNV